MITPEIEAVVKAQVEGLFTEHAPFRGQCENPVTGAHFFGGDSLKPQKEMARQALLARIHFAIHGPHDAPALPVSFGDRDRKPGGLRTLVSLYSRSWEARNYDLKEHPSFYDYACGAMASEYNAHPGMKADQELLARFPPRHLEGLGPGLYWEPPEEFAETMAICEMSKVRERASLARALANNSDK